ncbi:hypothetical protein PC116_g22882 [Phytophthora cactorum]|nr:hypothetical protein PC116_g22882 [Phytophthora cactorum]
MENTAKRWIDMNRRLSDDKRTWKNVKKVLFRRYREQLDKSTAE